MDKIIKDIIELGHDYMNHLQTVILQYEVGIHVIKHPDHEKTWFIDDGQISFFKSNFFRIHSVQIDAVEISTNDILFPIDFDKVYLQKLYSYGKEFLDALRL